jgi:small subunit ribosomal protein S20
MPHTMSARKRLRQNLARQERNRANRSALKKALRAFEERLRSQPAEAGQALPDVYSALDRAVRKGAIPKGRANRKKSRLAAALRKVQSAPAPPAPPATAAAPA